jgi:predicted anti-sigma-YlaC factor YlaD
VGSDDGGATVQLTGRRDRSVTCERVRSAVSAKVDGEVSPVPAAVVERHLAGCSACSEYRRALTKGPDLAAVVALSDPPPDPALASRVVAAAAGVDRAGVWWVLRAALGAVALAYLAVSVPELLVADDPHHGHLARHLGAFELAYGVALCSVVVRPALARAMVPFTAALALAMAGVAVTDVARGEVPALAELTHLLEVAGLVLVWLLATRRGWPRRQRSVPR